MPGEDGWHCCPTLAAGRKPQFFLDLLSYLRAGAWVREQQGSSCPKYIAGHRKVEASPEPNQSSRESEILPVA